ncbi:hypothetical protein RO07_10735 [Pandoraea pulmonicola]|uniref:Major facilitator superfamily (MFS) profile domain-containing protein n=1 Tax=Pandoraea pulmonicola TaxID=93221 RepID=A0AAJ5D0J9_PANPU|nr:hypothetical protein RO07_10735 [Pandoraea pulmonicola]SUA90620.1 Uncharacterised protein [Pandoraea pulmonicola]
MFLAGTLTLMAFGARLGGMAHNSVQLVVARFILGLGGGGANPCFAPELRLLPQGPAPALLT